MQMLPFGDSLLRYVEKHSSPDTDYLRTIYRETWLKTPYPNMISGPMQGAFLRMVSQMMQPSRILEVGSFTGYSALCLAEGLRRDGILDTLESNPEIEEILRKNIEGSTHAECIKIHMGNALEIVDKLEGPYDLAFIDADKEEYLAYYEKIIIKMRPGGYIIADNVLWGGKVLEANGNDPETRGIVAFNEAVTMDSRVERLMLPIRDGLFILRVRDSIPKG